MIKKLLVTAALSAMMAASAYAADMGPAIVFDIGGKFDKSFNESMFNGADKFKKETNVAFGEFEIANEAQREEAIRNFADKGYSPIVAAGFAQAAAVEKVAKEFPDLKFAIVDMVVICQMLNRLCSRSMRVLISSAWLLPWRRNQVRLDLLVAWIFL